MEVDRVLRPGGYWVLSGPPINWKANYKSWQQPREDLEKQQRNIEETAKLLCWEKKYEKGETAIWRKRVNKAYCQERESHVNMCQSTNPDDVWYIIQCKIHFFSTCTYSQRYKKKRKEDSVND